MSTYTYDDSYWKYCQVIYALSSDNVEYYVCVLDGDINLLAGVPVTHHAFDSSSNSSFHYLFETVEDLGGCAPPFGTRGRRWFVGWFGALRGDSLPDLVEFAELIVGKEIEYLRKKVMI